MRGGARWGEAGAASVLAVGLVALLTVVALAAAGVTGLVAAHRRAQAAADLAALAGATSVQEGGGACAAAARVAVRNGARLSGCAVRGEIVLVDVEVRTPALAGRRWVLPGRARAGPVQGAGRGS